MNDRPMKFNDFFNHPDQAVAEAAQSLHDITEEYQAGHLLKEEYQELVSNITDLKQIVSLTDDANRQNQLTKSFQQLYAIASVLGKFI